MDICSQIYELIKTSKIHTTNCWNGTASYNKHVHYSVCICLCIYIIWIIPCMVESINQLDYLHPGMDDLITYWDPGHIIVYIMHRG